MLSGILATYKWQRMDFSLLGIKVQQNRWKGPNSQIQCFTMGREELGAENAEKTPKLEKLKRKLLNVLKWYDLYRVVP